MSDYLPNRLAEAVCNKLKINIKIADTSNENIKKISEFVNQWTVIPVGTEGYKTAEVTLGGCRYRRNIFFYYGM